MTASRADELARAFDADFARAVSVRAPDSEDLLAIRIAGDPYALVRGELAGLFTDKPVTPLPGAAPGLLGISGFRGAIIPVYELCALVGGGTSTGGAPRWLVTVAAAPVALAFDRFDAFLRVPRAAIAIHAGAATGHARRAVQTGGETRPILDVASIVETIRARARRDPRRKP
jgi:chemotaxis signal transduction protein